ncbi:MAG: GNAT family N-acetyltransferase [Flavobacteriales bacterium]
MAFWTELQPIAPYHADEVQVLLSDPAVLAWTSIPEPYPQDGAKNWIEEVRSLREEGKEEHFAIINEKKKLVGVTGLQEIEEERAELGYWIGKPYWNQGYASKANQELVRRAFQDLDLKELYARPLEQNASSQRVLEKLGFEPHGLEDHETPKCRSKGKVIRYVLKRP